MELNESQRVAQVGNWQWIVASDTITWSPGYYRIIGRDMALPPPDYKGHLEIYTQESAARMEAAVAETLKNGTPYELDMELLHPDGSRRFMVARGEAVRDAKGQVAMLRGTLQDITHRKQAEEELNKYREHLEDLVKERTGELNQKNEELEKFNGLFVGRELRMIELKKKIAELEKKIVSPVKEELHG
ncbi:MAG TPA: PAS domain-containing protein [Candidatus Methanoperedens sp.]